MKLTNLGHHKRLILILLTAAILRLAYLASYPVSLYWEEAALGYDAFSLLKTGKDYHGNPWPLVAFESFGDYKPSGYFYALLPFIAVLGLNEWAVRLPSAIAGIATVGLVYLIATHITGKKEIGLWSAFILAWLPWHIQFSRAGFEVNLATFWYTAGFLMLLKSLKNPKKILWAALLMVLAMYTYHGLRLLGPITTALFVFWHWPTLMSKRQTYLALIMAFLLLMPVLLVATDPQVQQRFDETNFLSESRAVEVTNMQREEDGNAWWARLIHHRYLYWSKEIASKGLEHFQIDFLLFGDGNQRHQTGFFGLIYLWQLPVLIIGLIIAINKRYYWLLIPILFAVLPPAITKATPHTLRFLPAAPFMAIIIGAGMVYLSEKIRKIPWLSQRLLLSLLIGVMAIESLIYVYDYLTGYPQRSSHDWQYGYKELTTFIKERKNDYETIYISRGNGRPSIYFLFYWQIDPFVVQSAEPMLPQDQGELLEFENLRFQEPLMKPKTLAVTTKALENQDPVKKINDLNGETTFFIYEN